MTPSFIPLPSWVTHRFGYTRTGYVRHICLWPEARCCAWCHRPKLRHPGRRPDVCWRCARELNRDVVWPERDGYGWFPVPRGEDMNQGSSFAGEPPF